MVDDRSDLADRGESLPLVTGGGSISIESYSANLAPGSSIDVAGGVAIAADRQGNLRSRRQHRDRAGQDPKFASLLGGQLTLRATLEAIPARPAAR